MPINVHKTWTCLHSLSLGDASFSTGWTYGKCFFVSTRSAKKQQKKPAGKRNYATRVVKKKFIVKISCIDTSKLLTRLRPFIISVTSESIKIFKKQTSPSSSRFNSVPSDKMKRSNFSWQKTYLCLELCVWTFMTYSAVHHGKMFDYEFASTEEFALHIDGGGNWYYRLMFGNLNPTNIDDDDKRSVQGGIFN